MANSEQIAVIDLLPNHWARINPFVPEIAARLQIPMFEFSPGGPLGHSVQLQRTDEFVNQCRFRGNDVQKLPQGLVPVVVAWLKDLGFQVEIRDQRKDSHQWVRDENWKQKVRNPFRKVLAAVEANKDLRVIAGNTDLIADTVTSIAQVYSHARIAVGVPTYELLRGIMGRLRWRLKEETLGLYTAKNKTPGRVSVGLIKQLPLMKSNEPEFDLLVLPFAEKTVFDDALRVITSEQYRRLLSFTPVRWTGDAHLDRRLMILADTVYPPEKKTVPVTVVMLESRGTRNTSRFEDALDAKRKLYWQNNRRNRFLAEVARQLVRGRKNAVRSIGIDDRELVEQTVQAAQTGVAILVETPEHARELAKLLPGWAVCQGGQLHVAKPEPKCGMITTELGADETVISAGILIRATGTKWPLPDIDWPWVGDVEQGVLIDFQDQYHPDSFQHSRDRVESYEKHGMTVWELTAVNSPTDAKKATVRDNPCRVKSRQHDGAMSPTEGTRRDHEGA